MQDFATVDWNNNSLSELDEVARRGPTETICSLACDFEWDHHPVQVLNGIMARKNIDLATALTVFFNAGPLQYNYIGKRDVPIAHRDMCRVLDTICQRVNCGYYLPQMGVSIVRQDKLRAWINYQQDDAAEGRAGRWVLDEHVVKDMAFHVPHRVAVPVEETTVTGISMLDDVVKPLIRLGESLPFMQRAG